VRGKKCAQYIDGGDGVIAGDGHGGQRTSGRQIAGGERKKTLRCFETQSD